MKSCWQVAAIPSKGCRTARATIPDVADRASEETDRALELRTRDRQRKLVTKIDARCAGSTRANTATAK